MSELTIRKMLSEDLGAVMALLKMWNMAPRRPSSEEPEVERDGIEIANSFVAESDGRIVGVCSYIMMEQEGWAETASLAVDPSAIGCGAGSRLQEARLKEMRMRGIRRVHTETDRPATVRWYVERFGYRIVGRKPKKHNFSLPDVDYWTVLELNL